MPALRLSIRLVLSIALFLVFLLIVRCLFVGDSCPCHVGVGRALVGRVYESGGARMTTFAIRVVFFWVYSMFPDPI